MKINLPLNFRAGINKRPVTPRRPQEHADGSQSGTKTMTIGENEHHSKQTGLGLCHHGAKAVK